MAVKFSVIIPSKDADNLEHCVAAIRMAGETCRIIAVDDGLTRRVDGCEYVEGFKPFVYARNCNMGIRAAGNDDVILLNDDGLLETPGGFSLLAQAASQNQEYGLIAAVTNSSGNPNQRPRRIGLRKDPRMVCFVCVYIPRSTLRLVGDLDEDFTGYGFEDDSYCLRVRRAGLKIGIHDFCKVDHLSLPSSFRARQSAQQRCGDLFDQNREIFVKKYGTHPL